MSSTAAARAWTPSAACCPHGAGWHLDWWIGADDRWRVPAHEAAVRQVQLGDVPVVETAMRVPGGDALHRVYGAGDGVVVVEIENASPAPFVAAFVVGGTRDVTIDAATVRVDGAPALISPRAPSRWAASRDATTFAAVADGGASSEPFPGARDGRRGLEVAFLHPVAHRTTLRAALLIAGAPATAVDLRELPDVDAVVRAWSAQLDRGMRVELPDPSLAAAVRAARAELLVWPGAGTPVTAAVVAALEDWGFDVEAAAAWHSLGCARGAGAAGRVARAGHGRRSRGHADDGRRARPAAGATARCSSTTGTATPSRSAPVTRGPGSDRTSRCTTRRPAAARCRSRCAGTDRARRCCGTSPPARRCARPGLDPNWSTSLPRGEALLAPREVTA